MFTEHFLCSKCFSVSFDLTTFCELRSIYHLSFSVEETEVHTAGK